ncbi:hypothetical protein D9M72_182120 [compost metagenome]
MKRSLCLAGLIAGCAATSYADPVFLNCTLHNFNGREIPWEVAFDEPASRVTVSSAAGTHSEPARFWADRVQWGVQNAYTISRVDLSLIFDYEGKVTRGTCTLRSDPRKF